MSIVKLLLHFMFVIHNCYICYILNSLNLDDTDDFYTRAIRDYNFGFLTLWNFALNTVYFAVTFMRDINRFLANDDSEQSGSKPATKTKSRVQICSEYLFTCILMPQSIYIPLQFWSLYFVDMELVYSKAFDALLPWFANPSIHGSVAVFILIEFLLGHNEPPNRKRGLIVTAIYGALYTAVFVIVSTVFAKRWLYAFYNDLEWYETAVVLSACNVAVVAIYLGCHKLQTVYATRSLTCKSVREYNLDGNCKC